MPSIIVYLLRLTAILGFALSLIASFSQSGGTEATPIVVAWGGGLVLMALAEIIELLVSIRDQSRQTTSNSP